MTSDMGLLVHQASLGPPNRQVILQQTSVDIEGMDLEKILRVVLESDEPIQQQALEPRML